MLSQYERDYYTFRIFNSFSNYKENTKSVENENANELIKIVENFDQTTDVTSKKYRRVAKVLVHVK